MRAAQIPDGGDRRRPYRSPELRSFGTLSEITGSQTGNVPDGFGGSLQV